MFQRGIPQSRAASVMGTRLLCTQKLGVRLPGWSILSQKFKGSQNVHFRSRSTLRNGFDSHLAHIGPMAELADAMVLETIPKGSRFKSWWGY